MKKKLPRKGDTVIFKGKEAVVLELENDGNMAKKIYVQDNQKRVWQTTNYYLEKPIPKEKP